MGLLTTPALVAEPVEVKAEVTQRKQLKDFSLIAVGKSSYFYRKIVIKK